MNNKKLDRRSKYSIDSIKKAYFDLIKEKSVEKISVTELCEIADVNRGTFYKYFKDVYDLANYVEDDLVDMFIEMTKKNINNTKEILVDFFTFIENNFVNLKNSVNYDDFMRFSKKLGARIAPILEKDLKGDLANKTKKEIKEYVIYMVGGISSTCLAWMIEKNHCSAREIAEKIHQKNIDLVSK